MSFGGGGSFTIQGLIQLIAQSQGLQQMQGQLNGLANAATKADSNMQKLGKSLQRTGRSLEFTGARMSAAITAPLVGLGFAAGKAFVDFDNAFTKIAALVGVPAEELAELRQQVLALGPDVAQTPLDLANALYFVTSSGFAANEAMAVVDASARAAAAGLGSTALVADLVTTAMNAYGHENLAAADATDILIAAIREGKAEPEEFASALSKSIAQAALLGVGFDEVAASVATLSLAGIPAAEAGTALNTMFTNLIKPTDKAKEVLDAYGLSMSGLRDLLRTEGPVEVIRLLSRTFGENEEAMSSVFGNIRSLRFANSILALSEDQVRQVFDATANSAGDMNAAFEIASKSAGFKLKASMAELSAIMIQLGAVLIPMVVTALSFLVPIVKTVADVFDELPEPFQAAIIIFLAFVAALGPVLIYVGFLVQAIGTLIAAFSAGGVFAAGGALAFLGPVGLVLLGIIAILAALGVAYKTNFLGFGDAIRSIGQTLKEFFVVEVLARWVEHFNDFLKVFSRLREAGASIPSAAIRAFGSALEDLTGIEMSDFFYRMARGVDRFFKSLGKIGGAIKKIILAFAQGGFKAGFAELFGGAGKQLLAGIGDFLAAPAKLVGEFLKSIKTGIPQVDAVFRELANVWTGFGRLIQEIFQGDWAGALKVGKKLLLDFVQYLANLGRLIWFALRSAFEAINWSEVGQFLLNGLLLAIHALVDIHVWLVQSGWDLISGLLSGAVDFFENQLIPWFVENLADGTFQTFFTNCINWLFQQGWDLFQGFWNGLQAMWNWMMQQFPNFGPWITSFFAGSVWWLWQAGWDVAMGLWNGIVAGMQWVFDHLVDLLGPLPGWARFALGAHSPSTKFIPVGESITEGIAVGITRQLEKAKQSLRFAASSLITTGSTVVGQNIFMATSTAPVPIVAGVAGSVSSSTSMGGVTVNVNGAQDPNATADAVVRELTGAFTRLVAQTAGAKKRR